MGRIEREVVVVELIEYLVLGVTMGAVGGLFGIGGGLIAIPVLGILFGLDQQPVPDGHRLLDVLQPDAVAGDAGGADPTTGGAAPHFDESTGQEGQTDRTEGAGQ